METENLTHKKTISIIVPLYNEEDCIDIFFSKINEVLSEQSLSNFDFEILCVNDGSKDSSLLILENAAKKDKRIKVISLSRNFGKESALMAGVNNCTSDAAIPIDIDLQDPPELIIEMVKLWQEGYDVVRAKRVSRDGDSFMKKFTASLFYKIYNKLADRPMPENTGDFRLIDKKVIDAVKTIKDKSIFMRGVFNWVGFKSTDIEFERVERSAGVTNYNYSRMWNYALDGITSSSTFPLRIWTYIGSSIALISLIYALYIIIKTLIFGRDSLGYASLAVFILFFSSLNMIAIGVIGEYIGKILIESKDRPIYIIEKTININK